MTEQKRNIIFFYQYFGTPKGSWSTRVYELCKRWVAAGHRVTVVTAPFEKSDIKITGFIKKMTVEGIKVIVINSGDSNRYSFVKRAFKAVTFSLLSLWYALTLKYNLCIASSGPITIGLPMILSKKLRRKKTIFEVRDLWPAGGIEMGLIKKEWQKKMALWFEKACYQAADMVIAASKGQKDHIADRFPHLKLAVIPNASDLELFAMKNGHTLPGWISGKKIFSHTGSLGLMNNAGYWVKVATELKHTEEGKNIHLVFIGDGKDRLPLEQESEALELQNIHFLGLKPKVELPQWVQNSVATLWATSKYEVLNTCSPNKIFDSFAAGKPLVQTSTGWIRDLIEEKNCGINVDLEQPKEAAQKLIWMSKNPTAVAEMGKNAKKLAETEFNRDILSEKYLTLLKEVSEGYK